MPQIKLRDWDAAQPVQYLDLLTRLISSFCLVTRHEQLINVVGIGLLRDISNRRDVQQMDGQGALPDYFDRKSYQYCDGAGGRGVLEAVFSDSSLVNARVQYFMAGWSPKKKAIRYLNELLVPSLEIILGPPFERASHHVRFSRNGMVVIARYVTGTPSVSTYLIDEAFV